jgi:segregation and condensation protein A
VTVTEPVDLLEGYRLRLPVFEGPLDVLLRLIERDQLAITDVSLVAVTEQFVAYVALLSDFPPKVLAEFTAIAARLLVLKSRSLLPAPPAEDGDEETDDLAQQLIAYQSVMEAAAALRARELAGLRAHSRGGVVAVEAPGEVVLLSTTLPSLVKALTRCVNRRSARAEVYRAAPGVSLAAMTRRLLGRLGTGRSRLSTLLGRGPSRTECAVGFIALLSLLRLRVIEVRQDDLFGEIEIERRAAPTAEAADA